jgi:hypothetical protein
LIGDVIFCAEAVAASARAAKTNAAAILYLLEHTKNGGNVNANA